MIKKLLILIIISFCHCTSNLYLKYNESDGIYISNINSLGNKKTGLIRLSTGDKIVARKINISPDSTNFIVFNSCNEFSEEIIDKRDWYIKNNLKILNYSNDNIDYIRFDDSANEVSNAILIGTIIGFSSGIIYGTYDYHTSKSEAPLKEDQKIFSIIGAGLGSLIGIPIGLAIKHKYIYHIKEK